VGPVGAPGGPAPPGGEPYDLRAHPPVRLRARALVAAARGRHDGVETDLPAVEKASGDPDDRYWQARVHLDLAEGLAAQSRTGDAVARAGAAMSIFEELRVAPVSERARRAASAVASR
jgi:hypothetical protein